MVNFTLHVTVFRDKKQATSQFPAFQADSEVPLFLLHQTGTRVLGKTKANKCNFISSTELSQQGKKVTLY